MRFFWGKKRQEDKQGFSSSASAGVDLPAAIMKNKEAISTMEKKCVHIEKKINNQQEEARERLRLSDKRGAMLALKRKKMYEKELESVQNSRLTLEQQIMSLESAQTQQIAVGALAAGVHAHKIINQQFNITKIDGLVEDMQEQQDLQQEVAQVLSQGQPIMNDEELLNELSLLEANEIENKIFASDVNVPSAPLPNLASLTQSTFVNNINNNNAIATSSSSNVGITSQKIAFSQNKNTQQSDEEQLRALMGELA